jgi:nitrate/nitrite transport system permease protein
VAPAVALKLAHPAPAAAEAAAAPRSAPRAAPPAPRRAAPAAAPPARFAEARKRLAAVAAATLPPLVTLALLVAVWEAVCARPGATLPPPSQVLADTWPLIADPFYIGSGADQGLFWQMLASLRRVFLGYAIAAVVGVAIGAVIGQSRWAMRGLDPLFQVLRTVPPLAWLPLSLAAFQNGQPAAIFVIFITAVWPIIINTAVGVRNIPEDYRNVARVLQLSQREFFFKIMIPAAAPYIFTGLRIGVGLSWLAIVAAEMLIGGVGIGFFIWDAWNSSRISDIILALVCVGVVGFLLDRAIGLLASVAARGVAAS